MTIQAPALVTPLEDLCVRVVAANFEGCPTFGPLADKHVKKIIDVLPLDLPLELVGTVRRRHAKAACGKSRPQQQVWCGRWQPSHGNTRTCGSFLQLISDEDYWKRRSQARWKNCEVRRGVKICMGKMPPQPHACMHVAAVRWRGLGCNGPSHQQSEAMWVSHCECI